MVDRYLVFEVFGFGLYIKVLRIDIYSFFTVLFGLYLKVLRADRY